MEDFEAAIAFLSFLQPTTDSRKDLIRTAARNLLRDACRAIEDEAEYSRLKDRQGEAFAAGDPEEAAMLDQRAKMVHRARCLKIKAVSTAARDLMRAAGGTLLIDESTVDTGLDRDERRQISEVRGSGECV